MSWWKYLFAISVIVATAVSSAIQFVDKDSFGTDPMLQYAAAFLLGHHLLIGFVASMYGSIGVLTVLVFKPRLTRRMYRESLIDGIFEQVLDNDRTKARITIFVDAGFFRKWWKRAKDLYALIRKRKWKVGEAWKYALSANYIRIRYRWGTEFRKSKTYFCVNFQTAAACQGVAGQVRQQEIAVTVNLPRLDGIDHRNADDTDHRIADYMNQGHISDIHVLRSINRPAPFIYGAIVSTNGGKKKYVLVVDSWADRTPFVGRVQTRVMPAYIKQISAVLDTRS